jgi:hypothetical protein
MSIVARAWQPVLSWSELRCFVSDYHLHAISQYNPSDFCPALYHHREQILAKFVHFFESRVQPALHLAGLPHAVVDMAFLCDDDHPYSSSESKTESTKHTSPTSREPVHHASASREPVMLYSVSENAHDVASRVSATDIERYTCTVLELNPFYHGADAALFDRGNVEDYAHLLRGDPYLRLVQPCQSQPTDPRDMKQSKPQGTDSNTTKQVTHDRKKSKNRKRYQHVASRLDLNKLRMDRASARKNQSLHTHD